MDPAAYAIPLVEVALGVYLALGLLTRPAAIASTVLLLVFVAAQAQAWARGLQLDCGCFGAALRQGVGLGSILRDIALVIPGAAMALRPGRHLSLDRRLLGRTDAFGAIAMAGARARSAHVSVGPQP